MRAKNYDLKNENALKYNKNFIRSFSKIIDHNTTIDHASRNLTKNIKLMFFAEISMNQLLLGYVYSKTVTFDMVRFVLSEELRKNLSLKEAKIVK